MLTALLKPLAVTATLVFPLAAEAACAGRNLLLDRAPAYLAQLDARTDGVPFPRGRLFEVTRDGATSTVFGTMHLSDTEIAPIPDAVRARIAAAKTLLVEMTRDEQSAMMMGFVANPGLMIEPSGRRVSDMATEAQMAELDAIMVSYQFPRVVYDRMQPWLLGLTLSLPACLIGEDPDAILDARLEALAHAKSVPVTALDRAEEFVDLLTAPTYDEQLTAVLASLPMAAHAEDHLATAAALYRAGEIWKIWAFAELEAETLTDPGTIDPYLSFFEDILLTDRNRRWIDRMLPALAEGGAVVAVGALHLPGENGLLALLQAEGFEVRALSD